MSDISARLRQVTSVYDASYPPSLFQSKTDPEIWSLNPTFASLAGGPVTVTVTGVNFVNGSVVEVDQAAQTTTFGSATSLSFTFVPVSTGYVSVTVRNPNDEESNDAPFSVGALTAADVASRTIAEVKAWIGEHPEDVDGVLENECAGQNRSTLIAWLEDQAG